MLHHQPHLPLAASCTLACQQTLWGRRPAADISLLNAPRKVIISHLQADKNAHDHLELSILLLSCTCWHVCLFFLLLKVHQVCRDGKHKSIFNFEWTKNCILSWKLPHHAQQDNIFPVCPLEGSNDLWKGLCFQWHYNADKALTLLQTPTAEPNTRQHGGCLHASVMYQMLPYAVCHCFVFVTQCEGSSFICVT